MDGSPFTPAYVDLVDSGEIDARVEAALAHLAACDLCAWECGVNRAGGRLGICKTSRRARVASFGPHMGEEDPLRGQHGSGTIFFAHCNLRCVFCQNHDISQRIAGQSYDAADIAGMMLDLQTMGCHNINLVSPSHVVAQIIEAVAIAARQGLRLPLVYNTGGYDSLTGLRLLDGIVDIYMPDLKYDDTEVARRYSKIPDYVQHNREALREMHGQVGDLEIDDQGIARRGLLVRHLVLPGDLAGTAGVMRFLATEISRDTYVNIMGQYRPAYLVRDDGLAPLDRPVTADEMREAYRQAEEAGLHRFDGRMENLWS